MSNLKLAVADNLPEACSYWSNADPHQRRIIPVGRHVSLEPVKPQFLAVHLASGGGGPLARGHRLPERYGFN